MHEKLVPLFVSCKGMNVIVFGGGPVALRKCRHFEGADITVVSPDTVREMDAYYVIHKRIDPETAEMMMEDFDIVVTATGDAELNNAIRGIAVRKGIPVNSAHGGGTVVIPSVLRRDGYAVCVSTEGSVPAFPPFAINELNEIMDERFDMMYGILKETRSRISGKRTQKERSALLREITENADIRNALERRDLGEATRIARELEGSF